MKTVTFITTGQPTTNPRLVKEAETLCALGYRVNVICCFYQNWAKDPDQEILSRTSINYIFCGGDPDSNKLLYLKTRIRQKLALKLFSRFKGFGIPECAISRTHAEALTIAKKLPSDIYIAHNLGALPAAIMAAEAHGVKAGYDAEDMHSGQFSNVTDTGYQLNKYIEEKYFDRTNYFTAAGPLIGTQYQQAYPYLQPVIINNVFPKKEIPGYCDKKQEEPLKLFWFSQTVGQERGIEEVVKAIGSLKADIQLHLLGKCLPGYRLALQTLARQAGAQPEQLYFHGPVSPLALLNLTAQFDVGLATETGSTLNRDICLTNKIFTYIQCGLPIIASDTQGQAQFMAAYPASGLLYNKQDIRSLANCIDTFYKDRQLLNATGLKNYNLGQHTLNWETESRLFLSVLNKTIG